MVWPIACLFTIISSLSLFLFGGPFAGSQGGLLLRCDQESKVGLRWRTEQEVVVGKGQFACGAKGCDERQALASYEVRSPHALQLNCNPNPATLLFACLWASLCAVVSSPFDQLAYVQVNFAYKEAGVQKQALVKLRLCPKHALQLNHKQNYKLIKKRKREQNEAQAPVSKQSAHSNRDEAATHLQDNSGSDELAGVAAQLPDAANANKSLDCKRRRSTHRKVFAGLFD